MPGQPRTIDIDEAVKDPEAFFASPMEVADDPHLVYGDKERILVSWCDQAELLSEATAENMTGGERPRLQEAKLALLELKKRMQRSRGKPANR